MQHRYVLGRKIRKDRVKTPYKKPPKNGNHALELIFCKPIHAAAARKRVKDIQWVFKWKTREVDL
jgi:hypothetical protein